MTNLRPPALPPKPCQCELCKHYRAIDSKPMTDNLSRSPEKWWHWNWDHFTINNDATISYSSIDRWRRGWVTLYKFVSHHEGATIIEWQLYLPFNLNVGIQIVR